MLHPLPSTFSRYKKYVFLDPLAGAVTKTHVMLGAETEEKLFDAPLSISRREQLERQVDGDDAWGWERCGPPSVVWTRGLISPLPAQLCLGAWETPRPVPWPPTPSQPTGPGELLLRARPGPGAGHRRTVLPA